MINSENLQYFLDFYLTLAKLISYSRRLLICEFKNLNFNLILNVNLKGFFISYIFKCF